MRNNEQVAGLKTEAADEQLAEVAGGLSSADSTHKMVWIYTSFFTQVGVYDNKDYHVEYYPCPRCGKPMHSESYNPKWYCDPCNYSKFLPSSVIWNGTIDELKAAAS